MTAHYFRHEHQWLTAKAYDITSTEVSSLFGMGRKSHRRLWHEKKGDVEPDFVDGNPVKWGRRLQVPVAMGICEDQGWTGADLTGYYFSDETHRLGSSFDVLALCPTVGQIMLEIKLARFLDEEDGWAENAAPMQYEFQLQAQLHAYQKEEKVISGCIGVLSAHSQSKLYFRDYDPALGEIIDDRAYRFWKSIKDNNPPPADYALDGDLLEKLRKPLRRGHIIDLTDNAHAVELARKYEALKKQAEPLKIALGAIKHDQEKISAELLDMIGQNESARIGEFKIGARRQTRHGGWQSESTHRRFDFSRKG